MSIQKIQTRNEKGQFDKSRYYFVVGETTFRADYTFYTLLLLTFGSVVIF